LGDEKLNITMADFPFLLLFNLYNNLSLEAHHTFSFNLAQTLCLIVGNIHPYNTQL
jgi:hypothetical protein